MNGNGKKEHDASIRKEDKTYFIYIEEKWYAHIFTKNKLTIRYIVYRYCIFYTLKEFVLLWIDNISHKCHER